MTKKKVTYKGNTWDVELGSKDIILRRKNKYGDIVEVVFKKMKDFIEAINE